VLIKNCVKNDDGGYDFQFSVNDEEAEYLIHLAIETLIRTGVIQLEDQDAVQDELDYYINNGGKVS
jgi:hypothetical protein